MNKTTKLAFVFCILLVISLVSVSAADSWKHAWDQFWREKVALWSTDYWKNPRPNDGDIYGWYNNTDVANIALWELLVCSSDLAPEVEVTEDSVSGESITIYTTTITLTALKSEYNATDFLYEVSWYFQPLTYDSSYQVFLVEPDGTQYYIPNNYNQWKTATALAGVSDYIAFYSQRTYEKAVLNYTMTGGHKLFEVSVVEKKEG